MALASRCIQKTLLRHPKLAASTATTSKQPFSRLRRCFGSGSNNEDRTPKVVIQKLGDFPYGSREYQLVLQRADTEATKEGSESESNIQPLASLRAHRNIVFGAQFFGETAGIKTLDEVCLPLLDAALEDAADQGEQPQAIAALHGLCDYVTECLEEEEEEGISEALQKLKTEMDDDLLSYHAVKAIATGIPREGHSVVGQGTYRDGEAGWEALAQEFINKELAEEVELYRARSGTVVTIEHLADTNPQYLKSAGGAMVRLFFT